MGPLLTKSYNMEKQFQNMTIGWSYVTLFMTYLSRISTKYVVFHASHVIVKMSSELATMRACRTYETISAANTYNIPVTWCTLQVEVINSAFT